MKKIVSITFSLMLFLTAFAQSNENSKVIELARLYKNFMFINDAPKDATNDVYKDLPESLKVTADFIKESITKDNDLLKDKFLKLPDSNTLRYIYFVSEINNNMRKESAMDNNYLLDSLKKQSMLKYALVDNYYSILFASILNKNKPFNYSKVDFKLNNYNLSDDTEKAIFFLQCMEGCGSSIWGYINIVKPANTKEAMKYIKKFPKFNGSPYYQFTEFGFPDFEMKILDDKGKMSYKGYYLDKYYQVLISHLVCLKDTRNDDEEFNKVLLGSILKQRNLYKYSSQKSILEGLLKVQDL